MLWTVVAILVILWLLGVIGNVGGEFIHVLIIVAGAVLIFNLIRSRRAAF